MSITTQLTKKVGPIPRWVLIGMVGGVIVGLYLRQRSSVEDATVTEHEINEPVPATTLEIPVSPEGYGMVGSPSVLGHYAQGVGTESEIQIGVERAIREWMEEQPAPTPTEPIREGPQPVIVVVERTAEPTPPIIGGGPPAPIPKGPKAPSAPAPPAPTKPGNYHAGDTVHNAANTVRKTFSGASGWIELNTPDNRFADFHVAWPGGRLERWRGWGTGSQVPRDRRGKWEHIWTGNWK